MGVQPAIIIITFLTRCLPRVSERDGARKRAQGRSSARTCGRSRRRGRPVRPAPAPPRAVAAAITASTTARPAAGLVVAARPPRRAVGSRRDRATTTCLPAPFALRGIIPPLNHMYSFSSCVPTFDPPFPIQCIAWRPAPVAVRLRPHGEQQRGGRRHRAHIRPLRALPRRPPRPRRLLPRGTSIRPIYLGPYLGPMALPAALYSTLCRRPVIVIPLHSSIARHALSPGR